MGIETALIGSLPRPPILSKYVGRFRSGKISEVVLERKYVVYTKRALSKLISMGYKVVTDGMFRHDDILNPFISFIDGVKVNGLYRFYENNFFFRIPIIEDMIKLKKNVPLITWYLKAKEIVSEVTKEEVIIKPVIPGPATFVSHSINMYYKDLGKFIADYVANVLEPLIGGLKKVGADVIEIHEPALVASRLKPKVIDLSLRGIYELSESLGVKIWLQVYFGSLRRLVKYLKPSADLILSLDLVESPEDIRLLKVLKGVTESIALGIVDARNTKIERFKEMKRVVDKALRYSFKDIYLCPNTLLDFLPEVIAYRKLRKLARFVKAFRGD
ncbi:MAG TPA: 5-methyltetrahydropteroyltriglutamate--homocysteine methyltransferase [Acidilobales archaeon]|nr:5-methyltetrahydropteroyltriglutamate--homocysteine methyltransferase [Acidilobales archaeon]